MFYVIKTILGGVKRYKLWLYLALGTLVFAFSCKQANNGGEQKPTTSDDVTITIQGDEGVIVNKLNTIKVKKSLNLTWKDIKQKAVEKITTKENKEIKEWRLKDAKGEVLKDTDTLKKDETVWCVSKNKEKPPTNPITITIEADEGYTFKEATKPCTIEVEKNSTWASLKPKAEARIELVKDYEIAGWKLGGKDGILIKDETEFKGDITIFAVSKKKGEPDKPKVTITVKGDEGVEVGSPNNFTVDSGSKWASIKTQAEEKAKPKENFEIKEWHLNNKEGTVIKDETEFKGNTTIFAVSKRKVVQYNVEHLKENIEDENYTKAEEEEETKTGEAGKNTSAEAKQYEGFSCQGLAQAIIKADGSTVVQIKYKRNRVSLILDLAGGKTTPALEDGSDGKKLLKGKFEAKVEVKGLEKENHGFEKWEPALPEKFPAMSSNTIYIAKWTRESVTITVKGDENVVLDSPKTVNVAKGAKWAEIKAQVMPLASVKENFEIIEWYLNNKDGTVINDETEFNANTTVFVVSKRKIVKYRVEYYQENIEDNEFTLKETEEKTGEAGKNTEAIIKRYEGFICQGLQGLLQTTIKADGSTVVQINYKRKIVFLTLDLNGGRTIPPIVTGGGGYKLLEGKFEARVEVKGLEKENHSFEKWEPALPEKFPATNPITIYNARWTRDSITITIEGDEGVEVKSSNTLMVDKGSKWAEIKTQVMAIASAKENFEVDSWRLDNVYGTRIKEWTEFKENTKIFAKSRRQEITITVEGDEDIEVKSSNTFITYKGLKWKNIKAQAMSIASA